MKQIYVIFLSPVIVLSDEEDSHWREVTIAGDGMGKKGRTWYGQPKVHHGDFSATLAASLASETRPTLKIAVFF